MGAMAPHAALSGGVACAHPRGVCQQPGDVLQRKHSSIFTAQQPYSVTAEKHPCLLSLQWRPVVERIPQGNGPPLMATRHLMGADTGVSDNVSPAMFLLPAESRKK